MTPHPCLSVWRCRAFVALGSIACLVLGIAPVFQITARAQSSTPGTVVNPADLAWPRFITVKDSRFAVYQPQIDSWRGVVISGRFAVGVRSLATSNETYGVAFFKASTDVDKVNRLVTLSNFQITKTSFPTRTSMEQGYLDALKQQLPQTAQTIPLDHLEAVFALSAEAQKTLIVNVKNDPPRVIYCTEPSVGSSRVDLQACKLEYSIVSPK